MSDRLKRPGALVLAAALGMLVAPAAFAALDPPSSGAIFGFPAMLPTPATATSAGRALADRWLGDAPWDAPAAPLVQGRAMVALLYDREDRQDLSAANRQFDAGSGALDFGSAAIGAPLFRRLTGWLYTSRPETRTEDVAYLAGRVNDPTVPSAVVTGKTDTHEDRSGGALSLGFGALRLGAAVELTHRRDDWTRTLESGAPESGTYHTDWSGHATGGQVGFHWAHGDSGVHALELGGALRRIPQLEVKGANTTDLLIGTTDSSLTTTRAAGWEGGVSAAYRLTASVRVFGGAGTRSAMSWSGLGLESGRWSNAALALDYHDTDTPWTLHLGYALDQESQVAEAHAGSLGLGFGWDFGGGVIELGGVHRSVHRSGQPTSYEDRVLLGFHAAL